MTDETSEAVLGDAVADSLERPGHRRRGLFGRKKPSTEETAPFTHCEDCGAELHGRYCAKCGQVAVDYHRSFRHVIADVAESFLNWDSKFTKTIGLLLISPGWLTNQFVAGRRTRYLHPLRVYLLVSIVFFLCARFVPFQVTPPDTAKMTDEQRAGVEEAMHNPGIPQAVREQVLQNLAEQKKKEAAKADLSPTPGAVSSPPSVSDEDESLDRPLDGAAPPSWLKQKLRHKIGPHGSNVELLSKTLRDNISTMMLFCIPLFALVLKILYLRQRRFYIEHLVYALHIHAFFYIAVLLTVFSGVAAKRWAPALEGPLLWILVLAIVVQVFHSIRQVYRQSWFMTTFKFFFGGFVYLFVIVLALAITAFATIALP
ncbi:MAG: DUF3667 domain-containing protein [Spartobacteria bacterium]